MEKDKSGFPQFLPSLTLDLGHENAAFSNSRLFHRRAHWGILFGDFHMLTLVPTHKNP
jgi:hypothetical protein